MAGNKYLRFYQPRDLKGWFTHIEADLSALMAEQSKEYQEQVAEYIHEHIGQNSRYSGERKSTAAARGNRLEAATREDGNRKATDSQWIVGDPEFLDTSIAKYWRAIEEGSADAGWSTAFTNMEIRFGAYFPDSVFRSVSVDQRNKPWFRDDVFKPNRDYLGQHAYDNVWKNNEWAARTKRDLQNLLDTATRQANY